MLDADQWSTPTSTLLKKAIRHPLRAVRRLVEEARYPRLNDAEERDVATAFLVDVFDSDVESMLDKHLRSELRAWLAHRRTELNNFRGPYRLGSTPPFDCETIYLLVRSLKPEVVVETGVCYGASSVYILQALQENGRGKLYSIDLGNTPDEPPNDYFVPRHLMDRWRLIIGDSKHELPRLLRRLGKIDLFHHDSLHTYEHMMWEYDTAFPHLRPHGILSSHDVRTMVSLGRPFQPNPFVVFCARHHLRSVMSRNVGIALRSGAAASRRQSVEHAETDARVRALARRGGRRPAPQRRGERVQ
jgi:predicted O-methyltransferase YrrM